ncbi:MAG: type II toxin-antitoxin system mRNA interferase toxin, RelE/StbE family [bacterium]|nr:type II toxin-antitoxin system mRNA interferase toxin, RelE/StbE family [bacterium]
MIEIRYAPTFVRMYKKLDPRLKHDVKQAVILFKERDNHLVLRVHTLHGRLSGMQAFSVNYKIRIVFEFKDGVAHLLYVGHHDDMYR